MKHVISSENDWRFCCGCRSCPRERRQIPPITVGVMGTGSRGHVRIHNDGEEHAGASRRAL